MHLLKPWRNPAALLRKSLGQQRALAVVQIGAGNPANGQPLRELLREQPGWRALFVEPVPGELERLKEAYGSEPRFVYENAAISGEQGDREFYYVNGEAGAKLPELPPNYGSLGSFQKADLFAHFPGIGEAQIASIPVPALPLAEVLRKHGMDAVDLLAIESDSESGDVLKQLDLAGGRPRTILLNHSHLRFEDRIDAMSSLSRSYTVRDCGGRWLCEAAQPER